MKYMWKRGARTGLPKKIRGKDAAQVVGERLAYLQGRGPLTAEAVLQDAENERSPLHAAFQWDDTEAAQQWRLEQARSLIRSVVVIRHELPDNPAVRAFVNIGPVSDAENDADGGDYIDLDSAMRHPELREQVVGRALAEANSWSERYRHLSELGQIHAAIQAQQSNLRRKEKPASNGATRKARQVVAAMAT